MQSNNNTTDSTISAKIAASKEKVRAFQQKQREGHERLSSLGIDVEKFGPTAVASANETVELRRALEMKVSELEERNLEISFLKEQKRLADEHLSSLKSELQEKQKSSSAEQNDSIITHLQSELEIVQESLRQRESDLFELNSSNCDIKSQLDSVSAKLLRFEQVRTSSTVAQTEDACVPPTPTTLQRSLEILSNEQLIAEQKRAASLEKKVLELSVERTDLASQLEEERHRSEILAHEVGALPEYIEVYHKERKNLQLKSVEREERIRDLLTQNTELKTLLSNLERIIRNLSEDNDNMAGQLGIESKQRLDAKETVRAMLGPAIRLPSPQQELDFAGICFQCRGILWDV